MLELTRHHRVFSCLVGIALGTAPARAPASAASALVLNAVPGAPSSPLATLPVPADPHRLAARRSASLGLLIQPRDYLTKLNEIAMPGIFATFSHRLFPPASRAPRRVHLLMGFFRTPNPHPARAYRVPDLLTRPDTDPPPPARPYRVSPCRNTQTPAAFAKVAALRASH